MTEDFVPASGVRGEVVSELHQTTRLNPEITLVSNLQLVSLYLKVKCFSLSFLNPEAAPPAH